MEKVYSSYMNTVTQPAQQEGMSQDTKIIITVLMLLFFLPAGIVLTWIWMKWPKWVKIVITLPVFISILAIVVAMIAVSLNPRGQIVKMQELECKQQCNASVNQSICVNECLQKLQTTSKDYYQDQPINPTTYPQQQ